MRRYTIIEMHCIQVNTLDNEGFRLLFVDVHCDNGHIHSGSNENCRDLCADDEKCKYFSLWKDDGYNFCETYLDCSEMYMEVLSYRKRVEIAWSSKDLDKKKIPEANRKS